MATVNTYPTDTDGAGQSGLFDRAVCLLCEMSRLGIRRRVASRTVIGADVQTDADLVKVSKVILESPELEKIAKIHGECRRWLRSLVSSQILTRGAIYVLSFDLVERVDARLAEYSRQIDDAVADFLAMYERRKAETLAKLGDLGDDSEYPDLAKVAGAFNFRWQYFAFGAPAKLQQIRADIWQREAEKAQAAWTDAMQESIGVLRAAFADLVSHMLERLEPGEDGKPKIFRDSLVRNFADFLDTFNARNIADDAELAALVERTREVLAGVDAADLRKHDDLRWSVSGAMTEIKARLDTMIVARPGRKFIDEE